MRLVVETMCARARSRASFVTSGAADDVRTPSGCRRDPGSLEPASRSRRSFAVRQIHSVRRASRPAPPTLSQTLPPPSRPPRHPSSTPRTVYMTAASDSFFADTGFGDPKRRGRTRSPRRPSGRRAPTLEGRLRRVGTPGAPAPGPRAWGAAANDCRDSSADRRPDRPRGHPTPSQILTTWPSPPRRSPPRRSLPPSIALRL